MTVLSIAELCTFALIAWLLWLERREEMCALADPGNGERTPTENKQRGLSLPPHRERSTDAPSDC